MPAATSPTSTSGKAPSGKGSSGSSNSSRPGSAPTASVGTRTGSGSSGSGASTTAPSPGSLTPAVSELLASCTSVERDVLFAWLESTSCCRGCSVCREYVSLAARYWLGDAPAPAELGDAPWLPLPLLWCERSSAEPCAPSSLPAPAEPLDDDEGCAAAAAADAAACCCCCCCCCCC